MCVWMCGCVGVRACVSGWVGGCVRGCECTHASVCLLYSSTGSSEGNSSVRGTYVQMYIGTLPVWGHAPIKYNS